MPSQIDVQNSKSSHDYPSWFDNARQHFLTHFDASSLADVAGENLRQPMLDAIGVGRRIRPSLYCAFWTAETGRNPQLEDMTGAIGIELFHAASIIVDDLADKEDARRDKLPLFLKYGEEIAVLTSHALVASGYKQLTKSSNPIATIDLWNDSYVEACLGQSLDYRLGRSTSLLEQQAMSLKKTEAFFGFVGSSLDLLLHKNSFETAFKAMGRIFQVGNDVIDLMSMDTSSRMIEGELYPLGLSFLVPQLVDMGLVNRDEVCTALPLERLHEIAFDARQNLPSADEILSDEAQLSLIQLSTLPLLAEQAKMCEEFIRQCCTYSFWNHNHEKFT